MNSEDRKHCPFCATAPALRRVGDKLVCDVCEAEFELTAEIPQPGWSDSFGKSLS